MLNLSLLGCLLLNLHILTLFRVKVVVVVGGGGQVTPIFFFRFLLVELK